MGPRAILLLALSCALAAAQLAGAETRVVHAVVNNELPAWSPDGEKIAFHSTRGGNGIWTMSADGSRQEPLTSNTRGDAFPAWSPDGKKIAFTRGGSELYVVAADGSEEPTRLGTGFAPTWAPEGDKLAFADTGDGGFDVFVMNADGTGAENVTRSTAWDTDPDWSPGGRKIAFVSDRRGTFDVYVMNPDGSEVRRITTSAEWELGPDWSPDGRRIAYTVAYADGTSSLMVVNADGTGATVLSEGFFDQQPDWSPDGRRLAFKRDADIYVADADGTKLQKLTGPPAAPNCVVPNLRGKTLAATRKALTRARCALGQVGKARSATVKRGRVISQKPKAGKQLPPQARVNVVLSLGPKR